MGLEAATYIHQLNPANPVGAVDPKGQGDDHLRLLKSTIQATFPNITGAVTVTHTQLNTVGASGVSGFAVPANKIKGTGAAGAGVATTAMRSDAQIVQDLTDAYAWTGQHSWTTTLRAPDGALATPAFTFSADLNTGFYRTIADQFAAVSGGSILWVFDNNSAFKNISRARIENVDGSAANPAYSFESDSDTGFYRIGANQIGVAVNTANIAQFVGNGTGEIVLSNGTVAFPSYSFISDSNTGFYSGGADILSSAVGGVGGPYIRLSGGVGGLFLRDGTVANPGLTFDNDTNTGLYFRGADRFAFSEGGTGYDVGYRNVPQNSQSANYTCVQADSGKHILHPNGGGAGDTFTIPANASVAYDIGTVITFINRDSNSLSIAITSDTLILAGSATTGTRTLAQNGVATAIKVEATTWIISGTGIS